MLKSKADKPPHTRLRELRLGMPSATTRFSIKIPIVPFRILLFQAQEDAILNKSAGKCTSKYVYLNFTSTCTQIHALLSFFQFKRARCKENLLPNSPIVVCYFIFSRFKFNFSTLFPCTYYSSIVCLHAPRKLKIRKLRKAAACNYKITRQCSSYMQLRCTKILCRIIYANLHNGDLRM